MLSNRRRSFEHIFLCRRKNIFQRVDLRSKGAFFYGSCQIISHHRLKSYRERIIVNRTDTYTDIFRSFKFKSGTFKKPVCKIKSQKLCRGYLTDSIWEYLVFKIVQAVRSYFRNNFRIDLLIFGTCVKMIVPADFLYIHRCKYLFSSGDVIPEIIHIISSGNSNRNSDDRNISRDLLSLVCRNILIHLF